MKRIFGAALVVAALQAVVATASADQNRRDDRDRDREGRKSYVIAAGGAIEDHDVEYDIPGGEVEISASEGDVWSIGWGHQSGGGIRSETIFTYSEQDIERVRRTDGPIIQIYTPPGDIQVFSISSMGYFDFARRGYVRPYIGAGLGISNIDLNDRVESGAGIALSARFSAGLRLMVSDNAALFAEARYDAHLKDIDDGLGFSGNNSLLYMGGESAVAGLKLGF